MEEDYLSKAAVLDESQLERLLSEHWDDVRNYIFILTRHQDAVDDLAQDTFIRAFRSLSSFRGESSFKTWLLTIARNVSLNYRTSAWLRKIVLFARVGDTASVRSAEAEYFERRLHEEVWAYVWRLPVKLREVVILDARYQLSMKEISTVLGIPEGTVKSRISRARKTMSQWLEGEIDNDGFGET